MHYPNCSYLQDYSNQNEIEHLYNLGKDVFKILTIHTIDENEMTLAELEQRCAGCSKHDLEDHEQNTPITR